MNDLVFLAVFYVFFMGLGVSLFREEGLERAFKFHKDMYWGRLLGRRRYFVLTRILVVAGMVGATIGVVLVLMAR